MTINNTNTTTNNNSNSYSNRSDYEKISAAMIWLSRAEQRILFCNCTNWLQQHPATSQSTKTKLNFLDKNLCWDWPDLNQESKNSNVSSRLADVVGKYWLSFYHFCGQQLLPIIASLHWEQSLWGKIFTYWGLDNKYNTDRVYIGLFNEKTPA